MGALRGLVLFSHFGRVFLGWGGVAPLKGEAEIEDGGGGDEGMFFCGGVRRGFFAGGGLDWSRGEGFPLWRVKKIDLW